MDKGIGAYIHYIKTILDMNKLTADFYNDHVVTAVEQGLLKDVTPKLIPDISFDNLNVCGDVEFPDGTVYRIVIYKIACDENRPIYECDVYKVK